MFDTKTLNDTQSRVVMIPADKHILCVAGPGSGKTRTMTYRIAYLALERNVLPSRLRAVTFSTDLQTAEGFEAIGEVIEQRASAEKNGDVKALTEATGQSDRTARRKTKAPRKQRKVELKQQALVLYAQGQSYRVISKALGKAPNTIKNWCKGKDF